MARHRFGSNSVDVAIAPAAKIADPGIIFRIEYSREGEAARLLPSRTVDVRLTFIAARQEPRPPKVDDPAEI